MTSIDFPDAAVLVDDGERFLIASGIFQNDSRVRESV